MRQTSNDRVRRMLIGSRGTRRCCLGVIAFVSLNLLSALSPLTPESHASYTLSVSTSANRTSPHALAGAVVSGPIYVFTGPATGVASVRFYLDDVEMTGTPRQIENNAPFDFAGGTVSLANPFDTSKISTGTHTITAALRLSSGATTVVSAAFTVEQKKLVIGPTPISMTAAPGTTTKVQANLNSVGGTAKFTVGDNASWLSVTSSSTTTPATLTLTADTKNLSSDKYSATVTASADGFLSASEPITLNIGTASSSTLLLSSQADRSNPHLLSGATVAQNVYVFLGSVAANRVRFFVDDPAMTRAPFQTEMGSPYDLAGGSAEFAEPFDTRRISDGTHTVTAAIDLSTGGTTVVSASFTVANGVVSSPPPSSSPPGQTVVSIHGNRFYINDIITYRGKRAEGLLMNARMVNSVFEDTKRSDFKPDANTDEFIRAMPDYVAHGVLAFTLSLQGGNPSYEGAVNTAFRSDGSLKSTYLARVKRVIQAANSLGAVVILGLYYQRQDQHLANADAVRAGVVNVMRWITNEGFGNVLVEIANEYPHGGYDHSIIRSSTGMASLINLARATAPHLYIAASGLGTASLPAEVAKASDFLLIHANEVGDSTLATRIDALKGHGKPIVINEDPSESAGSRRATLAVQHGASWGLFLRKNQAYPFTFGGSADASEIYDTIWSLTH